MYVIFRPVSPFTLAIETSGSPASIAIQSPGREPAMLQIDGARPEIGRELIPLLDRLCKQYGASSKELSRVVVGLGPGSYTGLRIGIAAAKSLAFAAGKLTIGFPSTLAAAAAIFNDPRAAGATRAAVALDALRGEFAFALYERGERFPRELLSPRIVSAAQLQTFLKHGDAIASDRPELAAAAVDPLYIIEKSHPHALLLLELDRAGAPPHPEVTPLYLRASAAEENAARANREFNK